MIKVFEDFDFSTVGRMQSLLESHGISTFLKNEFGSSVVGELPFVEVIPQLFIIEERDLTRAQKLLLLDLPQNSERGPWDCPECRIEIEAEFDQCWQCGTDRPEE